MRQMIQWIKNKRKGFSLAEVLIVIAIMGILAALGFPAIVKIRDNLRQTELDETAKQIFIAAQNKMAGLKLAGVKIEEGEDDPIGLPSSGENLPDKYVTSDQVTWMKDTMFAPVNMGNDKYVIEYNSSNMTVYGVFYWEEGSRAFQKKSTFDYKNVTANMRSDREVRKTVSVGYYGGDIGITLDTKQISFDVIVENADELKVCIKPNEALDFSKLIFDVEIASKTDTSSKKYNYHIRYDDAAGWSSVTENSASYYELLLDSLAQNQHFANKFSEISAGDDIVITVRGYSSASDSVYIPMQKAATTNSLFAGIRGENGKSSTVSLTCGRHLQNLAYEVSSLGYKNDGYVSIENESANPITTAKLKAKIDWKGSSYNYDNISSCWNKKQSLTNFYPISNNKTSLIEFDGNDYEIANIHITQGSGDYGLFGNMTRKTKEVLLSNITIVNILIDKETKGTGGITDFSAEGSLVGHIEDAQIINCSSYLSDGSNYDNIGVLNSNIRYSGGLIGFANNVNVTKSFASVKVIGKEIAGGLIGELSGNAVISECYSGGHTYSGSYSEHFPNISANISGGLIGKINAFVENNKIEKSFSTCSVKGANKSTTGAFIGEAEEHWSLNSLEFTYSTGAIYYANSGSTKEIQAGGSIEQAANSAGGSYRYTDIINTRVHPYDETLISDGHALSVYPNPMWLKEYYGDWTVSAVTGMVYFEQYIPINGDETDVKFGFWKPGITPDADPVIDTLDYKDQYKIISDGYGFLTASAGIQVKLSDAETAEPLAVENVSVKISDTKTVNQDLHIIPWSELVSEYNYTSNSAYYKSIDIWSNGNKVTEYYNPHFAKAIPAGAPAQGQEDYYALPQTKSGIADAAQIPAAIIRTARQLQALGKNSSYKDASWSYIQDHDIDFESYSAALYDPICFSKELNPIDVLSSEGEKWYDGKNHMIYNAEIPTEDSNIRAAVFDTVGTNCKIQNVTLYSPKVGNIDTIDDGMKAAAFVFENNGTIANCKVINPKVYADSAAGFVSINKGTIGGNLENACYVYPEKQGYSYNKENVNNRERFSHTYEHDEDTGVDSVKENNYLNADIRATGTAAGFVTSNQGTISYCGVSASVYASGANGAAAGFVYANETNNSNETNISAAIEKSYSNCYTAATEKAAGFVINCEKDASIDSSYALRRVTVVHTVSNGDLIGAGFSASSANNTRITNSYSAVSLGYCPDYSLDNGNINYTATDYKITNSGMYPFSKTAAGTNCYYMDWTENGYSNDIGTKKSYKDLQALSIGDLKKSSQLNTSEKRAKTYAYSQLLPYQYPFPKVEGLIQYGDWPCYEYVGAEMAYYEVYVEKVNNHDQYTVGFYNEELGLNSLRDDKKIFLDGYGLLFSEEYITMDSINKKYLIEEKKEKQDFLNLTYRNNSGGTDTKTYLKSLHLMTDKNGKYIFWTDKDRNPIGGNYQSKTQKLLKKHDDSDDSLKLGYYDAQGERKVIEQNDVLDISNSNKNENDAIPEKINGDGMLTLDINGREDRYYFRSLPAIACITNRYVPSNLYQDITLSAKSAAKDEMGNTIEISGTKDNTVTKTRTFYYIPHFAKSNITTENPSSESAGTESNPLIIRTIRQFLSLGSDISGYSTVSFYYNKYIRQECNLDFSPQNPYSYYYVDVPADGNDSRNNFRWLYRFIGKNGTPFSGTYDAGIYDENNKPTKDCYEISGWGNYAKDETGWNTANVNSAFAGSNQNMPLFGYVSGTIKNLKLTNSSEHSIDGRGDNNGTVLCNVLQGGKLSNIALENFYVTRNKGTKGLVVNTSTGSSEINDINIKNCRMVYNDVSVETVGILLGQSQDNSELQNVTIENSSLEFNRSTAKYVGFLAGEIKTQFNVTKGANVRSIKVNNSKITCPEENARPQAVNLKVSFAGGVVGRIHSGNFDNIEVNNVQLDGDRVLGGFAGQICTDYDSASCIVNNVNLDGIAINMNQQTHNDYRYVASGLFIGLCQADKKEIGLDKIEVSDSNVNLYSTTSGVIAGLFAGGMNKSSGPTNGIGIGDVEISNSHVNNYITSSQFTFLGGLAGEITNVDIFRLNQGNSWKFDGCSISINPQNVNDSIMLTNASQTTANNQSAGIGGLIGYTDGNSKNIKFANIIQTPDIELLNVSYCKAVGGLIGINEYNINKDNEDLGLISANLGKINVINTKYTGGVIGIHEASKGTLNLSNMRVQAIKEETYKIGETVTENLITAQNTDPSLQTSLGGLIGCLNGTNSIQNVAVRNFCISAINAANVGGLAGEMNTDKTIGKSYAYVKVNAETNLPVIETNAGGFVGKISKGSITQCYASGNIDVTIKNQAKPSLGGFAGKSTVTDKTYKITDCFSTGNVTLANAADLSDYSVGGFVGSLNQVNFSVAIAKCYSLGRVEPNNVNKKAGGFVGTYNYALDSTLTYWEKDGLDKEKERYLAEWLRHVICDPVLDGKQLTGYNTSDPGDYNKPLYNSGGMDSTVRYGYGNSDGRSAVVYNILGYPWYPRYFYKNYRNGNPGNSETFINDLNDMHQKFIYDGKNYLVRFPNVDDIKEEDFENSEDFINSYYNVFVKNNSDNDLFYLWRYASGKLYWINKPNWDETNFPDLNNWKVYLNRSQSELNEIKNMTLMGYEWDITKPFENGVTAKSIKLDWWYNSNLDSRYWKINSIGKEISISTNKDCIFLKNDVSDYNSGASNVEELQGKVDAWENAESFKEKSEDGNFVWRVFKSPEIWKSEDNYPYPALVNCGPENSKFEGNIPN